MSKTYTRMINGREVVCQWQPRGSRAQHVDAVRMMVENGSRYAEIADALDIAFEAVRVIVYQYDIPYPHKAGRPKENDR